MIRRLRCETCRKIHHELPNILVPYKRYDAASIEQVVSQPNPTVAADESTLLRLRQWFAAWSTYAVGCMDAVAHRFNLPVKGWSNPSQSPLRTIGHYVGDADGWLARAVRPIANTYLWIHTRSACLSA